MIFGFWILSPGSGVVGKLLLQHTTNSNHQSKPPASRLLQGGAIPVDTNGDDVLDFYNEADKAG